jgi:ParB family chromosome partitioning protein
LDQAAGVAEFEDDTATVKALVAAARSGQFDHVLERARQYRDDAAQRAQAEAALAATGVRVIAAPAWGDAAKLPGAIHAAYG